MPPQTPKQNPPEDAHRGNHNKPLFFAALIICLTIIIFVGWYGYDQELQSARDATDAQIITETVPNIGLISTSTPIGQSGIKGKVIIGPTCPVEKYPPDPNCADKPYQTKLRLVKDDSDYVKFIESDSKGNFSIDLDPGNYIITIPDLSKQIPNMPDTNVTVQKEKYVEVDLKFDSGIR